MMWMMWMLGCAPKAGLDGTDGDGPIRIQMQADFSTEGAADLPPGLQALFGPERIDVELVVTSTAARSFRDGSTGHQVQFASAEAAIVREDGRTPVPLSLAGRSVEMRTFGDGELLDIDLIEHVVGPGRLVDVLDVIFPVISPAPPSMRSARMVRPRAMHWPIHLSRQQVLLNSAWLQWTIVDADREHWHIQYQGPWEVRGQGSLDGRSGGFSGKGSASGDVWIRRDDQTLQRHTFSWSRTVSLRYPSGISLSQTQQYTGEAQRL